ncbi:hypothetical protein SISNIDRAFT_512188 [Sistotremastrum niveocremeum HHB9708]|uniref:Uncharacterized protein n=1 Tax=Sistotremastrum niveocremeum HHB9708 TaxID=1314777 RepID=A0A164TD69_9AGAM|nr:hypothetical protein SISNIDRAFT_512188 [Sistotremastrum niveocremeum HHB9708]
MSKDTTPKPIPSKHKVHIVYNLAHEGSRTQEKHRVKITMSWPKDTATSTPPAVENIQFIVHPENKLGEHTASCGTLTKDSDQGAENCLIHSELDYDRSFVVGAGHQKVNGDEESSKAWEEMALSHESESLTSSTPHDTSNTCPTCSEKKFDKVATFKGEQNTDGGSFKITVLFGIQACHCDEPLQGTYN